jgi:RNA polymerase sigma factor (sigma-70 family)
MGIVNKGGQLNRYAAFLIQKKARALVGRCGFTKSDIKDLEQELWLDLLNRENRFDPVKGAETTFIAMIIDNRVATIKEHRSAKKRDYRTRIDSLDEEIEGEDGSKMLRHEIVTKDTYLSKSGDMGRVEADQLDRRADISLAIQSLSPRQRMIARLLQTFSITDAARISGVPRTTVNEIRNAIRKKFKKLGIDDWLK